MTLISTGEKECSRVVVEYGYINISISISPGVFLF